MRPWQHSLRIVFVGLALWLPSAAGTGRAQQPTETGASQRSQAPGEVPLNLRQRLDEARRQQQSRTNIPSADPAESSSANGGEEAIPADESARKLRSIERRLAQFFPHSRIRIQDATGVIVIGHPLAADEAGELLQILRDELVLAQVPHPLALREDSGPTIQRASHALAPSKYVLLQVRLVEFQPDRLQKNAADGWIAIAKTIDPSAQKQLGAKAVDAKSLKQSLAGMANRGIARNLAEVAVIVPLGRSVSLPRGLDPSDGKADTKLAATAKVFSLAIEPLVPADKPLQLHVRDELPPPDWSQGGMGTFIPAYKEPADVIVSLGSGQALLCVYDGRRLAAERVAVPILGDLPILGRVFQRISYEEVGTGTLLAITAQVVPQPAEPAVVPASGPRR